ncbi:hypothetical protein [Shewanella sp. S1-49-MNA-CIBAN-0167]|uniref:hypothetical protein n=1 Tax=Shewanella sp. S1-49-MNA-CIBAN-0167 TaxID=3140468 RepID=UPI003317871E
MPWLAKKLRQFNNASSLSDKLTEQHKVILTSNRIVWPLSNFTWALFMICLVGVPLGLYALDYYQYVLEATFTALAIILVSHFILHFKTGFKATLTKDAIELPTVLIGQHSTGYVPFSRVEEIRIQRFYHIYRYVKLGAIFNSPAKGEIYTHAHLMLNNGEVVNLSRANLVSLPEIVEYIQQRYSPKISYRYPMPLTFLGGMFLLYIVLLMTLIMMT